MKRSLILVSLLCCALTARAQDAGAPAAKPQPAPKAAQSELKTEDSKTLYLLGASLGQNISVFNLKPGEVKYVQMGLSDYLMNKKLQVDAQKYNPKINELAHARMAAKAGAEKKKDSDFIAQVMKEPGAAKTDSGLIYIPIKEGDGASPKLSDKVKVHYHGTLTNGTVFDSSVQRGAPAEFPLGGVIKCWQEGVQKMKVGGKAKLVCPSEIAYGDRGMPPQIPGGATLVFEVQLLEILKEEQPAK